MRPPGLIRAAITRPWPDERDGAVEQFLGRPLRPLGWPNAPQAPSWAKLAFRKSPITWRSQPHDGAFLDLRLVTAVVKLTASASPDVDGLGSSV